MVSQVADIGTLWLFHLFCRMFSIYIFPVSPRLWQIVEEAKLELKRRREEDDKGRQTRVKNIGAESVSEYCFCFARRWSRHECVQLLRSVTRCIIGVTTVGGVVAVLFVDHRREVQGTHSAGTVGGVFILLFASPGVCGDLSVSFIRLC